MQGLLVASKYFMPLQILIMIMIPYELPFNVVFGSSPSFSPQAIEDNLNDWALIDTGLLISEKNMTNCANAQYRIPYPDIAAVSYTSDGKVLNGTLWLSSPFKIPSSNSSATFNEIKRSYVTLISVDSVYNTTQYYLFDISWNAINKTWTRIIQQSSPSAGENNIFDKWENRVLSQKNNYSDFFDLKKNYIDLSLNLNVINSPLQYSVVSYASESYLSKNHRVCNIQDITDLVHIPPPEFSIMMSPSSLTLRPGEEKKVELQIKNNNAQPNSLIKVSTNPSKNIETNFTPDQIYVAPYGMATLLLDIKASKDAAASPHTIPIFAHITFPTSLTNLISGERIVNTESASITTQSKFTVTVLPTLRFDEHLNNFYNSWLAPVSGIAGLAAVVAPLLIYIYKKKQKRSGQAQSRT